MSSTHQANAVALVDTSAPNFEFVRETLLPALDFWGVPLKLFDLGDRDARLPDPGDVAVVLVLQEGLAERLETLSPALSRFVATGAGIVNLDPALLVFSEADGALRFAYEGWDGVAGTRCVKVSPGHFITDLQHAYREFTFRKPVPCRPGEPRKEEAILLDGEGSTMVSVREAPARIVSWRISSWVWSDDFLGFARGMDALLWRSLLWAARKPFALQAFPPLGRFRFDDCRGLWRSPQDLAFLDVMAEFGEVPNLGICLSALDSDAWRLLSERADRGEVEVVPHVREPDVGIFNAPEEPGTSNGRDPLTAAVADAFAAHRCRMARSVSDHNHELSPRGIRIARELGLSFRMNVMRSGETWEGVHRRWRPAPFGSMHFAFAPLPDAPDLFTAINHHASFRDAFLSLSGERFLCTPFGGFTKDRWDFLNGCVSAAQKDLDAALGRLVCHAELAITSLFFVGSISHTHFLRYLDRSDWLRLLQGFRDRVDGFGYRPCPYDDIAALAARHMQGQRSWSLQAEERGGATTVSWKAPAAR